MGSLARKAIGGSIHKIREFELEKVSLAEEFDILQIVGEGWFGKILLVEHKATDTEMVLKALPKPYTAIRDFYREFHYGLHLGAHRNIITTYDVAFETAGFYVFSQEYAPLGDLTSNVSETGIGELHTKRVARQLAAALEHLHSRDLVHRDVKLDNILVFKSDFSRVKLCDFGETRRSGSIVRRHNEWLPYAPPEVLRLPNDDTYKTVTSHDVWQFAIVVFVCLTGCLPWQKAATDDPRYSRYISWHCSSMPIRKQPKLFKLVSSKAQRLFRKFLEPRTDKRPVTLTDVHKFLDDRWLAKNSLEKNNGLSTEDDGLCPSMYSYHSSPEEKNKLLHSLTQYGIETTVDRGAKKDRIKAWIECSVIEEEEEDNGEGDEDISDDEDDEHVGMMDRETGPVGERMNRGPVEDKRSQLVKDIARMERQKRRERRNSVIKRKTSDVYTPPIDPRIPLDQQRFSRSEVDLHKKFNPISSDKYVNNEPQIKDDSGVKYFNKSVEYKPDVKPVDLKNALPFRNLSAMNVEVNKEMTPPKQNGFSNEVVRQEVLPPQQNGNHYEVVTNPARKDVSPPKQYEVASSDIKKDASPPKQNGNYQVVANEGRALVGHKHLMERPQINASLVENRNKGKENATNLRNSFKKKPMKERFEVYGSFEEKSTSSMSNSTGRSISK